MQPEQFEQWTSFLGDGMMLLSRSGEVLASNPAVADLGISRARLIGKSLAEFASRRSGSLDDYLKECARVSSPIGTTLSFEREGQEAEEFYCEALYDRWSTTDKPRILLKVKRREESKVRHFRALTEKIEALHREIAGRKKLEEEQRQLAVRLAELNRRKDIFLTDLASEMRELLDPIASSLGDPAQADGRSAAKNTHLLQQMQYLRALTDDLLMASRLRKEGLHLENAQVSLNELLTQATERIGERFEQGGVDFALNICSDALIVDGDEARLRQLLNYLLVHALRTASADGRVELSLSRSDDGEGLIGLFNAGLNLSEAELEHIFDVYSHSGSQESGGQLNVELTLVRQLAQAHGGGASAHQEKGGCRISVWLPLGSKEGASAPTETAAPAPS